MASTQTKQEKRLATVLGWIAGGGGALVVNLAIAVAIEGDYPVQPTSFVAFAAGAMGGMWAADKLGHRAVKVMGIATGVVLSFALVLFVLSGA